jgi:hypothetical protein
VSNSTDCNDSNPSINPSASETCDGIDNNCDGEIDEGLLPSGDQITELFSSVGTDIGGDLVSSYEPSGIVWHNGLDQLFAVSDGGIITRMNADGSDVVDKVIGGDLEGVTVADSSTNFVYVGIEQPRDSIQEYNYITQSVTRTFYLDSYMVSVSANQGLEALTFVPDASSAEDGYFYTGLQETGEVFVFELPIKSSTTSTIVHFVDSFTTRYSSDISDLYYDAENDILYGLYDSANKLVAMETDGTFIREWLLPPDARYDASIDVLTDPNSQDQEGFALGDACHIFLAEDSRSVWRY